MSERQTKDDAAQRPASFETQDATGLDVPAGKSAAELGPEDVRPATVTHERDDAPDR